MIPRIGNKVGELLEADIPGCYHLITGTHPMSDGRGAALEFEFLPSYERVNGQLVPMTREAARQALTRRTLHD